MAEAYKTHSISFFRESCFFPLASGSFGLDRNLAVLNQKSKKAVP